MLTGQYPNDLMGFTIDDRDAPDSCFDNQIGDDAAGRVGISDGLSRIGDRIPKPRLRNIGRLDERLILKPHSATGLIDRLDTLGLIAREVSLEDRRRVLLRLTPKAYEIVASLSAVHREEIRRLRPLLVEIFEKPG